MMQNFLAFRDSPSIPLRRSPYVTRNSRKPVNFDYHSTKPNKFPGRGGKTILSVWVGDHPTTQLWGESFSPEFPDCLW